MKILDVLNSPWAIQPEKLNEIIEIYSRHLRGDKIDIKGIEAKAGIAFDNQSDGYEIVDGVAVVPVHGVIAKRMNLFQQISGGVSTELLGKDIQHALNNEDVNSIILDIDSPGGTVDGTEDVAELIYQSRDIKKIVTLANGVMASGGMWIGSAASEIYIANNTTAVGSIGVVTTHVDYSEQLERAGVKVTEIFAGRFKRINSEYKPLTQEGEAVIQDLVDYLYSVFVNTIARNRGADIASVLDYMADGRLFIGKQSVDAELVDGVLSMDALIDQLNGKTRSKRRTLQTDLDDGFNQQNQARAIAILEDQIGEDDMPPDIKITAGYIMEHHADIADKFRAEGKESIDVEQVALDAKQGETDRIKSVLDQTMAGHESMINEMAFDGKTTGPEAAVKVLQAEKSFKNSIKTNLDSDAKDLSNVAASTNAQPATTINDDPNTPIAERCESNWKLDAKLRAEFNDDFDCYVEYMKASDDGLIKKRGVK